MIQKRVIFCSGEDEEYLHRWILLRTPWCAVYLHRFVLSDIDVFHDHPWDFISLILLGGYVEHRPGEIRRRGPLSLRISRAEDMHYVKLLRNPTWTLIIRGVKRREWGFQTSLGWKPWYEYVRRGDGLEPAQG